MRTWNERFFSAIPLRPGWVGAIVAATLVVGFVAIVALSGELEEFFRADERWWQTRNARLALLLALLAAYLPVARRYESLVAASCRADLQSSGLEGRNTSETVDHSRLAGVLGLLAVPLTAFLVDRDPSLYLRSDYWRGANVFIWSVGAASAWNFGVLLATVRSHARSFSQIARESERFDLLRVHVFRPFARYGLGCALLWSIALGLWSLNLIDRGFASSVALIGVVALSGAGGALLLPLRGAHSRIIREKEAELLRIDAALSGDREAMTRSAIGVWQPSLGFADLLAYRGFVEGLREWPLDTPTLTRFALYLGIPVGSWLGGAFVERVVDALLGP